MKIANSENWNRLENGLIKDVDYIFKSDGTVDWKAMIPIQYLYPQKGKKDEIEEKYGKRLSDLDLSKLDDKYLCVNLAGFRYIANLRGFTEDRRTVQFGHYNSEYNLVGAVTVVSQITWIPNFETFGNVVVSSDVGGASLNSVDDFSRPYIEAVAANRAFVRNVRGFLNIGLVGSDEISNRTNIAPSSETSSQESSTISVHGMLETKLESKKLSLAKLKLILKKNSIEAPSLDKATAVSEIDQKDIFTILSFISKNE